MNIYPNRIVVLLDQFQWYLRKHGLKRLLSMSVQRAINRWLITSRYLFVINLAKNSFGHASQERLHVKAFASFNDIPKSDLEQLRLLMGPGRSLPFLEHFFGYGAHLWIAKLNKNIVGLKWTLKSGFNGFFCIPIENKAVVSLAEQVFEPFRGQGLWAEITACILSKLKEEGVSRVYFGVHCRNKSMLRAVKKANIQMVGRVLTFGLPGFHLSLWRKRYLWRQHDY